MRVLRSIAFLSLSLLTFGPALAKKAAPKPKPTPTQTAGHLGYYDNAEGSPIYALIEGAESTLDMEVYEMDDPKVIKDIRDAISRGVVVRIVKEPAPVGAVCKVFESSSSQKQEVKSGADSCNDQIQLVEDVRSAGGQYEPFNKTELCSGANAKSCLQHGKIAVADSKLALISSGNFNTTNLCDLEYSPSTCNRDYTYLTDDADVIAALSGVVEKDLAGKAYDVSTEMDAAAQKTMTIGPDSLEPLVDFIKSATTRIQIENQYLKETNINNALMEAAKNGVQVEVVVESACFYGKPTASAKKQFTTIFTGFDKAGISSKMFNKNILVDGVRGYLHAKAIVVDEKYGWIGSVNGSTQATTLNREFGMFFSNSNDVKELSAKLESDFNDSNEETWKESLDCAENNTK